MIRVVLCLISLLSTAPTALGTPQDARDWSVLAEGLLNAATDAKAGSETRYEAVPTPPALRTGLQRFGVASSRLANEMASYKDAADLACIFRGMAEETDLQLKSLRNAETAMAQSAALTRIVLMLDDAVHVGEAAARLMETSERAANAEGVIPGACKAAPFR